ncbi:glycosyltransferase [Stieleria maiorica]|uniref:glycosyltransferase n=1 Tax=Stieleria maiorica TaxID=2795974 RepID=UPI00142F3182|nr:glycosyltransferase [Stieleria maiorica]
MSSSCLINNYNYGKYVCEAVDSALEQSLPFDEIIIVDDGSTDNSLDVLNARYGRHTGIRIVAQEQSGQLSCIQRAVEMASGELIFLLDSDDCQHRDLHATVQSVFQARQHIDFLSVDHEKFGPCVNDRQRKKRTRDQGVSALASIFFRHWVGAPTSCLSMRSSLLERILPYPNESNWRTRADDVLVLASSIVGAQKYHIGEQLVRYRVHESNHFSGRTWSEAQKMQYALKLNAMINWYVNAAGYDITLLPKLASKEFRTIEHPVLKELLMYLRLCAQSGTSLDVRCGSLISIFRHFFAERRRGLWQPAPHAPVANPSRPKRKIAVRESAQAA